jgi:capsular exopolysaccharide synthesis family protein
MHEETMAQGEISLRDYLDLLRRRSSVILQVFAVALGVGIVVALFSRPVYSGGGRLLVTPQNPTFVTTNASDPFSSSFNYSAGHNIETQIQVLMTPELMADAYRASNLAAGDPRVSVGISNEKEIDIINVTTEAFSPTVAADVTNNLMRLYIDREKQERSGDLDKAVKFADQALNDANAAWATAAKKLQAFQNRTHVPDPKNAMVGQNELLAQMETKEQEAQANLNGTNAEMQVYQQKLTTLPPTITTTTATTNPQIALLQTQLDGLNADMQALLAQLKPEHPKVKALAARITEVKATLAKTPVNVPAQSVGPNPNIAELETKVHTLNGESARYAAELIQIQQKKTEVMGQLRAMGGNQFEQAKIQQDLDVAMENAKTISGRLTDLRIRQVSQATPISILSLAGVNPSPVRPNRPLIVGLAALVGLFLGACLALLQEFLDDRVNTTEDARRLLSVPALGYIPNIEREDQRVLTAQSSGGSVLESYRVLRSNVRFASVDEPVQSILVTSTMPGEGKSVTAVNLAVAMALDGKRVVLVDADLRRPTIHEKFGIRSGAGLTNVLVGTMSLEEALQATALENLHVLTSGPIPPNPAELLNSRAMEQIQEALKERADYVIFDSPPCLSVADAQVLAATVDGLIYVIQLGSTKKSALRHGYELLRQAHARVLGVVYNKIQPDGGRSPYYYGYYSYYHKAELPSKSNGAKNGQSGHSQRHNDWETLTTAVRERESHALRKKILIERASEEMQSAEESESEEKTS